MKQIVRVVQSLSLVLCTSILLSGCIKQEPCVPVVTIVKPDRVEIGAAKVEQCAYAGTLDNVKCVMKNYVNMKIERDQLRSAYESVTK